jgi:hypothetical protein
MTAIASAAAVAVIAIAAWDFGRRWCHLRLEQERLHEHELRQEVKSMRERLEKNEKEVRDLSWRAAR